MKINYQQLFTKIKLTTNKEDIIQFKFGIEREALRVTSNGSLAQGAHPTGLGSPLTNPQITTDYSESLLELITPASHSIEQAIEQLWDLHRYTVSQITEELLWPTSMPCAIDAKQVPIANYGTSNIGQMKTLYRKGLKHRYGSAMQVIAGVHFNFSLAPAMWRYLKQLAKTQDTMQSFISDGYMAIIRNFYRKAWIIPYLFGASPALNAPLANEKINNFGFLSLGKETYFLPYATSLRLSDLGYISKEQQQLHLSYDSLADYLASIRLATAIPSKKFSKIGIKQQERYLQLNCNVLQIENELYAPIRPKRTIKIGERSSQALMRGIEYIEMRALDVNPFSPVGVTKQQLYFIQLLLLNALFTESPPLTNKEITQYHENLNRVTLTGRKPKLTLVTSQGEQPLMQLATELLESLQPMALFLDEVKNTTDYTDSLRLQEQVVAKPDMTLSGQMLKALKQYTNNSSQFALQLAKNYKEQLTSYLYGYWQENDLQQMAHLSLLQQKAIEQADDKPFYQYLADYFNKSSSS